MTPRELANLCCRLLALYSLIVGIGTAPSALAAAAMYATSGMPAAMIAWYVAATSAYPIMQILLGVWLWRKSNIVAAWMIAHDLQDAPDEPEEVRRRPTAREMHCIAFSTVGLWLLVSCVPALINAAVTMAAYGTLADELRESRTMSLWSMESLATLIQAILGAYLLFGGSGLVRILRGAKNFGLERDEQPELARRGERDAGGDPNPEKRA